MQDSRLPQLLLCGIALTQRKGHHCELHESLVSERCELNDEEMDGLVLDRVSSVFISLGGECIVHGGRNAGGAALG